MDTALNTFYTEVRIIGDETVVLTVCREGGNRQMTTTVAALYDDMESARDVIRELIHNGFPRKHISLITSDAEEMYTRHIDSGGVEAEGIRTLEGTSIGAVLGALTGLVMGLIVMVIPDFGTVVAAGPLAGAIAGTGAGAIGGSLVGMLADMDLSKEQAQHLVSGVRQGSVLVAVEQIAEGRASLASTVMRSHAPLALKEC
jgi:uncharacterized membrane protein